MTDIVTPPHVLTAIAVQNDAFRKAGPNEDWVMTRGVADRGAVFTALACRKVMAFDAFTTDNDPYGEHDFGAFKLDGLKLFWKIDCYDETYQWGSPDPTDPSVTRRVLTIMCADEY